MNRAQRLLRAVSPTRRLTLALCAIACGLTQAAVASLVLVGSAQAKVTDCQGGNFMYETDTTVYCVTAYTGGSGVSGYNSPSGTYFSAPRTYDPPTAEPGSITTAYGTPGSTILVGSQDEDAPISVYTLTSAPANGVANLSGSTAIYTPNAGFFGTDSFAFIVFSMDVVSRPAVVSVTVTPPPPPLDQDGAIDTGYGQATTVTLPVSGLVSSTWINTGPVGGSASFSGQQVTYTPSPGFYGLDSFTYQSSGPGGDGNVATISVNVARPPPPATANGVINTPYATAASATLPASGIISSYAIVTPPSHGSVSVAGSTVTYTPNAGFYGPDSLVFDANGPGGTSNASTISINVGLPPPPAAQNSVLTVPYNTAGSIGLTATGVVSSYALASQPQHGTASLSGPTATYTPAANYIGSDSFTFTVAGPGGTSSGTITVTVSPPPPPVANSAPLTCAYQTVCTVTLTTSGATTTITLKDPAANGSCTLNGNVLTYTPAWGAVGADSCTFTAAGPGGTSAVATVYVTNEAPPLPDPSGSMGPVETAAGGIASAICAAGQSASFPVLPGPPVGTSYDPNWCSEQALTIAQQALQIQNQLSAITNLQSQVTAAQRQLQSLGTDSTSATLQTVNTALVGVLQQAAGIGFNTQGAGVSFAAAYPVTPMTAGFNASQLSAALSTWQANTAAALKNSITVQNTIAQQQAGVQGAVQGAVAASNAAPGSKAATQATNQILRAVTTQLTQLQDILIASSQAYDVAQASAQQAGASAASVITQIQGQATSTVAAPPGVTDTSSL